MTTKLVRRAKGASVSVPSCYWASHLRLASELDSNSNEQPVRSSSCSIAIDIDLFYFRLRGITSSALLITLLPQIKGFYTVWLDAVNCNISVLVKLDAGLAVNHIIIMIPTRLTSKYNLYY